MKKYFTVDRTGSAEQNIAFQLTCDYSSLQFYEVQDVFSKNELIERVQALYPEGLSRHGIQYLIEYFLIIQDSQTGRTLSLCPSEPMIEVIFEQVRKEEFPHRPSRMQSMFAWTNLDDAYKFRDSEGRGIIYKVESDKAFIADMNLLYLGGSILGGYEFARKYWSGETGNNPKLEAIIPLPVVVDNVN